MSIKDKPNVGLHLSRIRRVGQKPHKVRQEVVAKWAHNKATKNVILALVELGKHKITLIRNSNAALAGDGGDVPWGSGYCHVAIYIYQLEPKPKTTLASASPGCLLANPKLIYQRAPVCAKRGGGGGNGNKTGPK